jgi:hypothetical protein
MATYFFETITAASALAACADTICFASKAGADGESGGGGKAKKVEAEASPTGSTLFSEAVAVGDTSVPATDVVRTAVQMSGLSVAEWNDLGQAEIDKRLTAVLEGMNATWRAARGSSGALVFDPLNPGMASLRMAQSVIVHHQELDAETGEPVGPHIPFKLNAGMNHNVPAWVAEHPFVRENLEK